MTDRPKPKVGSGPQVDGPHGQVGRCQHDRARWSTHPVAFDKLCELGPRQPETERLHLSLATTSGDPSQFDPLNPRSSFERNPPCFRSNTGGTQANGFVKRHRWRTFDIPVRRNQKWRSSLFSSCHVTWFFWSLTEQTKSKSYSKLLWNPLGDCTSERVSMCFLN